MFRDSIVIIGSIPINGNVQSIGGTTVLTKGLLDYLDRNKITFFFIQSNRFQGFFAQIKNFIFILLKLITYRKKSRYLLMNTSERGLIYVYPFVYMLSRVFSKKIVLRKFGGNFIEFYSRRSFIEKFVIDQTLFKSDLIAFETQSIIYKLPKNIDRDKILWLPNTRRSNTSKHSTVFLKRFVYIGQIQKSKGIFELIEASKFLPNGYEFHVYGPFKEGLNESIFNLSKLEYKGVVDPNEITETLLNYDVLLLPSYHYGEGYPGVVIEAMSIGVPSITTNWQSIPEIVKHNVNGILIPIKSYSELVLAIKSIDAMNFKEYSRNAILEFENFNEDNVYPDFLAKIKSL
jgi:glycosyltransferase involved in cell wall biosynthesis